MALEILQFFTYNTLSQIVTFLSLQIKKRQLQWEFKNNFAEKYASQNWQRKNYKNVCK